MLLAIIFMLGISTTYCTSRGILSLDEYTFDRIVDGSRATLVKFDGKWATSAQFEQTALEIGKAGSLLVAEVEVEEFEQPDGQVHSFNSNLRDRYGILPAHYPAFLLFKKGQVNQPKAFQGNMTVSFREWLRIEGGVYFGTEAVLKAIDEVARKFMAASDDAKSAIIEEAKAVAMKMGDMESEQRKLANTYVKVMEMASRQGNNWLEKERKRINRLSSSPAVTVPKREEFKNRLAAIATLTGVAH